MLLIPFLYCRKPTIVAEDPAIGSTLYFEITDLLAPANTKALNCWDFMILKCEPDDTVALCKAADRIVELA